MKKLITIMLLALLVFCVFTSCEQEAKEPEVKEIVKLDVEALKSKESNLSDIPQDATAFIPKFEKDEVSTIAKALLTDGVELGAKLIDGFEFVGAKTPTKLKLNVKNDAIVLSVTTDNYDKINDKVVAKGEIKLSYKAAANDVVAIVEDLVKNLASPASRNGGYDDYDDSYYDYGYDSSPNPFDMLPQATKDKILGLIKHVTIDLTIKANGTEKSFKDANAILKAAQENNTAAVAEIAALVESLLDPNGKENPITKQYMEFFERNINGKELKVKNEGRELKLYVNEKDKNFTVSVTLNNYAGYSIAFATEYISADANSKSDTRIKITGPRDYNFEYASVIDREGKLDYLKLGAKSYHLYTKYGSNSEL